MNIQNHGLNKKNAGIILINTLVFMAIAVTVTMALINWAALVLKSTQQLHLREQAFQIAEAGVEYYRWHLAHNPTDYKDGTNNSGPYVHEVKDSNGNTIGQYSLTITPPPIGSTAVRIRSTGSLSDNPNINRTIEVTMAIPSYANYAVIANGNLKVGEGTDVYGPLHSNAGIHFDGVAHNIVTSALAEYNDPEFPGSFVYGVYTTRTPADPVPPAPVPLRPDIFMAGRQFPVPTVDFTGLTLNLSQLKSLSQQSDGRYISSSNAQGYHVLLKTNDTFDLYKVTDLDSPPSNICKNGQNQGGWGIWSIDDEEFVANYPFPENGVVFIEDHFWIDGQIDGARITFASARFPEAPGQYRNIMIDRDLLYSNYDGTDVIGLISQGDINIGLMSEDNLRVDAALISQNGRAGRYHYNDECGGTNIRDELTLYGMIASYGRYGFAYTDGTGYLHRTIIFDENLMLAPPPSFPLISNQHRIISWEEIN